MFVFFRRALQDLAADYAITLRIFGLPLLLWLLLRQLGPAIGFTSKDGLQVDLAVLLLSPLLIGWAMLGWLRWGILGEAPGRAAPRLKGHPLRRMMLVLVPMMLLAVVVGLFVAALVLSVLLPLMPGMDAETLAQPLYVRGIPLMGMIAFPVHVSLTLAPWLAALATGRREPDLYRLLRASRPAQTRLAMTALAFMLTVAASAYLLSGPLLQLAQAGLLMLWIACIGAATRPAQG